MEKENSKTNYPSDGKKKGTFIVRVDDSQNGTWHGRVTWADREDQKHFRSTLELLKLLEGALEREQGQALETDESVS